MALREVKSRARVKGPTRKIMQVTDRKAQRKPKGIAFDGPLDRIFASEGVDEGSFFAKQRVPSIEELGVLLHSNLSSSLVAAKPYAAQREDIKSPPFPNFGHIERIQGDEEPPASLLELAPLFAGQQAKAEDRYASLLATTAIYRPLSANTQLTSPRAVPTNRSLHVYQVLQVLHELGDKVTVPEDNACRPAAAHVVPDDNDHNHDLSSLLPATDELRPNKCTNKRLQLPQRAVSPTDSCAIEDDDEYPVPGLINPYASFGHIKPLERSTTAPSKPRSIVLQRVVTLFAGRRRCRAIGEQQNATQTRHKDQDSALAAGQQCPRLPPRRNIFQPRSSTPPVPFPAKNLPRSPPIIAPQRPYRPVHELISIKPARETRYTGTYYVAPDIFTPEEVQQGFPAASPPASPVIVICRTNPDAELLDRDKTLRAKWYAKNPSAEHLPFAKANTFKQREEGQAEEIVDQQLWDAHAARHARFRGPPPPLVTQKDVSRQRDDEDHERAARLRYHPGHCFGALTGDVYPFGGGHII